METFLTKNHRMMLKTREDKQFITFALLGLGSEIPDAGRVVKLELLADICPVCV